MNKIKPCDASRCQTFEMDNLDDVAILMQRHVDELMAEGFTEEQIREWAAARGFNIVRRPLN